MFSQVTSFRSFIWMNNIPVCVCVCVYIFFIHLFLDGHLSCFPTLAAVIMMLQLTQGCIYLFKLVFLFSSEKHSEVELVIYMGFPCSSVSKESACNAGDPGWEDPMKKEMVAHSSFLPGESQGHRSLVGYSLWGCKSWPLLSD